MGTAGGDGGGGVYKSTDGGATWRASGVPLFPERKVKELVIDPSDPRTLYAGAAATIYELGGYRDGGVFKSTDGAMTWQPVNTGLPPTVLDVQALAIDPRAPTTLYARDGLLRRRHRLRRLRRVPTAP